MPPGDSRSGPVPSRAPKLPPEDLIRFVAGPRRVDRSRLGAETARPRRLGHLQPRAVSRAAARKNVFARSLKRTVTLA